MKQRDWTRFGSSCRRCPAKPYEPCYDLRMYIPGEKPPYRKNPHHGRCTTRRVYRGKLVG